MSAWPPSTGTLILVKQLKKERDFTVTPNSLYRDLRLDWSDLGMVQDLLHLQDGRQISMQWLIQRRPSGEFAVRSITQRLQMLGYLRCSDDRDQLGRVTRWTWEVCEWACQEWADEYAKRAEKREKRSRDRANRKISKNQLVNPHRGKPHCGFPTRGEPRAIKLNTENQNLNTTTTTPTELVWPLWFNEEQRAVVVERMGGLDQMLQQKLLDQFQGKMEKAPPRSPMDWFIGTIKNAWHGKFVLTYGDEVAVRRARRAQEAADEAASMVAAAEAEKRENELQARLNDLEDSQVLELLAGDPSLKMSQIEIWLQSGRPVRHMIASLARQAISRKK